MRPVLSLLVTTVLFGACVSTSRDPAAGEFSIPDVVASMQAEGASVALQPFPYEVIEGVTGAAQSLCINGYEAVALEYPSESARRAEVDDDPPDVGRLDLCWGTIGWWARGDVVIYFSYEPTKPGTVVTLLNSVMGPSIGRTGTALHDPPEEIPTSDRCA